jgi:polyisoprenoid-binding protein YceI
VARFRIVPARSFASIRARSSLHPIHSETDGLEGWLELRLGRDGQLDLRSRPSAHIELPVSRLRSGNALEERELRRRIDSRRYPTIAGDLTGMSESDGDGRYVVEGDVTFLGVARPHADQMTFERLDSRTLRLRGQSSFDVREFGLEPPRILLLRVEPIVTVEVTVVAEQED